MKKIIHGIEITIVSDKKSLSELAARVVLEYIQSKSNTTTNLLVPTGTSPIELYALLSEQREALKNTRWFNMDEYVVKNMDGSFTFIDPQNETSYHYYMSQHLFKDGFSPESHFPGIENISHPGTYDRQIQAL